MEKTKYLLATGALALMSLVFSSSAMAVVYGPSGCPVTASAPDCNLVITFNSDGSITTTGPGGTYDGVEDAVIGVVNNTNNVISGFQISGSNIFGFDGDGINNYSGATNAAAGMSTSAVYNSMYDMNSYGGENAYFDITDYNTGGVMFLGGIASNGGFGYFSLEEPIYLNALPKIGPPVSHGVPEPSSIALLGLGLVGLGLRKRKNA